MNAVHLNKLRSYNLIKKFLKTEEENVYFLFNFKIFFLKNEEENVYFLFI